MKTLCLNQKFSGGGDREMQLMGSQTTILHHFIFVSDEFKSKKEPRPVIQ